MGWGTAKGLGGVVCLSGRSLEDVVEVGQSRRRERLIGRQRGRGVADAKGFGKISNSSTEDLSGGGGGHGDLVGKPGKSVGMDSFAGSKSHTCVTAVAFQVRANIPAVNSRGIPSAALARLLVDDHMGA